MFNLFGHRHGESSFDRISVDIMTDGKLLGIFYYFSSEYTIVVCNDESIEEGCSLMSHF